MSAIITDKNGHTVNLENAFLGAIKILKKADRAYIIGNGGSASIASHMAEDYTKNTDIKMSAFNDAALITCFANDYGFERIFSTAIDRYATKKDLIIAISSSGKSENILNGVVEARIKGCNIITFTGFKSDNKLRKLGDLNFYIPDNSYGNVEISHLSLLHAILDLMQ